MKRLVHFKLNVESKWLTFSGVMMGIAFFLQAFDFFALRQLQSVAFWQLLLFLILPMVLEACWCVPLRFGKQGRAELHGVLAALICLLMLVQCVVSATVLPMVLGILFFLLGGAASVLITFGFISHRALGLLVFTAIGFVRLVVFALPQYLTSGYMSLVQQIPPLCMILGVLLLFGGLGTKEE